MANMPLSIGQVVYSKSGRDKRRPFIITAADNEYVYLVDGDVRQFTKPKKKKIKHIQVTNDIILDIKQRIESNSYINDSVFKNALVGYRLV